jgi:hypothetical protein
MLLWRYSPYEEEFSPVGTSWKYFKRDYVTQVEVDLQAHCDAMRTLPPQPRNKLASKLYFPFT